MNVGKEEGTRIGQQGEEAEMNWVGVEVDKVKQKKFTSVCRCGGRGREERDKLRGWKDELLRNGNCTNVLSIEFDQQGRVEGDVDGNEEVVILQ